MPPSAPPASQPGAGGARRGRRFLGWLLPLVVASLTGSVVAVALFGRTEARIGPFDTTLSAQAIGGGGTRVELAPLGRMEFASHDGPLSLTLRLDELRAADARAIARDPEEFRLDEEALTTSVREGVQRLAVRSTLVAVAGAALLALLWGRRWRDLLAGAAVGALAAGASLLVARQTWEPESLAQPRYSGLLTLAPQAIGDARDVVDRFEDYQAQLAGLIENVAVLYRSADEIRSFRPDSSTVRVLHVSDIHLNPQAFALIDRVTDQFAVDVVVDTGDINDWGTTFESRFARNIGDVPVPYVYVRGNHDSAVTARAVGRQPNAIVLDGERATVAGLTFWGEGDPRFTPDKSEAGQGQSQQEDVVAAEAPELADRLDEAGAGIDVAVVHDPAVAEDLGGRVPLVLAGHRHESDRKDLDDGTVLLVEGSTGGAGLRALESDEPVPLSCSVLYFDAVTGRLEALDRIVVGGVNQSDVRIERELFPDDRDEAGTADDDPAGDGTEGDPTEGDGGGRGDDGG